VILPLSSFVKCTDVSFVDFGVEIVIFGGILFEETICRLEDVETEKYGLAGDCERRNDEPLKEKMEKMF
jgi:hypothetical protein